MRDTVRPDCGSSAVASRQREQQQPGNPYCTRDARGRSEGGCSRVPELRAPVAGVGRDQDGWQCSEQFAQLGVLLGADDGRKALRAGMADCEVDSRGHGGGGGKRRRCFRTPCWRWRWRWSWVWTFRRCAVGRGVGRGAGALVSENDQRRTSKRRTSAVSVSLASPGIAQQHY